MAECEVLSKYKSIKVVPSGAKLIGEVDTYNDTIGFHITAFTAAMLAAGESSTFITEAERVKVTKVAGESWTAGDPVYWDEANSRFTTTIGLLTQKVGKVVQAALTAAVIGHVNFNDESPIQRDLALGTSSVPYPIDVSDQIFSIYTTSSGTGANVEPMIVNTILTGAGATGGRARFQLNTEVALGGWANALKALVAFGATGSVTGLGSAFVAELVAATTAPAGGTYAPLEAEIVMPSGAGVGAGMAYMYCNVQGDDKATFQGSGFFAIIENAGDASDGLFYDTANGTTDAWLRIRVNGTAYYMMLSLVATEA